MDKICEISEWKKDRYGKGRSPFTPSYKKIMGTKKYRKEQAKKKRLARRAAIIRVNALPEELAVIGY